MRQRVRWAAAICALAATMAGAAAQRSAITAENAGALTQVAVLGHGEANDVALAPNGKLLAVATSTGVLLTESYAPDAAEKLAGEFYAAAVAVRPDGSQVAAGGWDFSLRVWDIESGRALLETRDHGAAVNAVAYSADGTALASAGDDGSIRLWDAATLEAIEDYSDLPAVVDRLAFSPSGGLLAAVGRDGFVRVYDTATGAETAAMQGRGEAPIASLAFRPDGAVIFGDEWGRVTVWDAVTGDTAEIETGAAALDLAFDGEMLLTAGGDAVLRGRELPGGAVIFERTNETGYTLRAAAAAAGVYVTASGQDVTIWDATQETPVNRLWLPDQMTSAAYSADGAALAIGSSDGNITIYDARTLTAMSRANAGRGMPTALMFTAAGRLVAGWEDGYLTTIRPGDGAILAAWPAHDGAITGVAATDEPDVVMSAGRDGSIRFINLDTGAGPERERADGAVFTAIASDTSGRRLAVGNAAGRVSVFTFGARRVRAAGSAQLPADSTPVSMDISPDGRTLAVGSEDSALRLYALPDLSETAASTAFFGAPTGVAYGPDGSWLATSSRDGYLRVFDAAAQTILFETQAHTSWALGITVRPDGGQIVTVGDDGVARVWEAQPPGS